MRVGGGAVKVLTDRHGQPEEMAAKIANETAKHSTDLMGCGAGTKIARATLLLSC